jgi:hypothetical protein
MDSPSPDPTLLALLLALKNLKVPLSEAEQAKFFEIGSELEGNPNDWDFIYEVMIDAIAKNPSLNQLFEAYVSQLERLNGSIPPSLLPTEIELKQELSCDSDVDSLGAEPRKVFGSESNEIINVTVITLLKKDPLTITTQKLSFLKRFQKYMQELPSSSESNTWPI